MSFSDWLDYLTVSAALQPYWKAAVKYLLTHVPALCLGLLAFVCSKPHTKEGAIMNPKERKLDSLDVLAAYPLFIPLWVCAFVYLFMQRFAHADLSGVAFVLLLLVLWLRALMASSTRLFEYYAGQESATRTLNPETAVLTTPN